MSPVPDAEARLYRLLGEIIDGLGVPAYATAAAIEMIREGRPVREAAAFCLEVISPTLDLALQARAEATVLRAEIAVRERESSLVRKGPTKP